MGYVYAIVTLLLSVATLCYAMYWLVRIWKRYKHIRLDENFRLIRDEAINENGSRD